MVSVLNKSYLKLLEQLSVIIQDDYIPGVKLSFCYYGTSIKDDYLTFSKNDNGVVNFIYEIEEVSSRISVVFVIESNKLTFYPRRCSKEMDDVARQEYLTNSYPLIHQILLNLVEHFNVNIA